MGYQKQHRLLSVVANRVYKLDQPARASTCVVADSPHSGRVYPADFKFDCKLDDLRQAEDMAVDTLYDFLPSLGIPFLQAEFPRSYVDVNRSDAGFRKNPEEGEYAGGSSTLVRESISPRDEQPIYNRKLKLSEVFNRVAGYHKPYHDKLKQLLDGTQAKHGKVVHLNLHSMPSTVQGGKKVNKYDVIIGFKGGTTADAAIAEKLRDLLSAKGYRVGIDVKGFSGAEIVKRAGDPVNGRHSLQVEINRALYMDETTLALTANLSALQKDLKEVVRDFAAWCDVYVPPVTPPPPAPSPNPVRPEK